ncbi:DUF397 domain-containing protein [Solihabitans fulvus]|uniref:DUF397 domain-containing protein n=1 Tax=Solihabitans fulvus TaxID=1892852 RepID=A0A5B2X7L9_9PSEU|nr:DUF397 domain-containing protein [Solihabitans fulvus]KAA2259508.1 DUF397 domain-containing protein [Solihabitans fulvus]
MRKDIRDTGWLKSSYSGAATDNCVEVRWTKSSYSGGATDNCVEVGWFKSSHSGGADDNCVEVRLVADLVGVRDSKNPSAGALWVTSDAWTRFLTSTIAG